jgi:hypothetical protein
MAGFMAKQHHHEVIVFDLTRLFFLETGEPSVRQVEGYSNDGHFVGAAPSIGQVAAGLKEEFLGFEFVVQAVDVIGDVTVFNVHPQITQACLEEFIAHGLPPVHDR